MMSIRNMQLLVLFLIFAVTLNMANFIISSFYNQDTSETEDVLEVAQDFNVLNRANVALQPNIRSKRNLSESSELDALYDLSESRNQNHGALLKQPNGELTFIDKKRYKMCPEIPDGLGPYPSKFVWFDKSSLKVDYGGYTKVKFCKSRQSAVIIVPFTGKQPRKFIDYLRSFLKAQLLEYRIFAVTVADLTKPFALGKLINAAFTEIHRRFYKLGTFDCIIIHDHTIVPVNTRNLYRCSWYPRQLATQITMADNDTILQPTFDGAVALSHEQYIKVNGFTHFISEKDVIFEDMAKRLLAAKYFIEYTPMDIGGYITLGPKEDFFNMTIKEPTETTVPTMLNPNDGLTTLSYTVLQFEPNLYYTLINFQLGVDPTETTVDKGKLWSELQNIIGESTPTLKQPDYDPNDSV